MTGFDKFSCDRPILWEQTGNEQAGKWCDSRPVRLFGGNEIVFTRDWRGKKAFQISGCGNRPGVAPAILFGIDRYIRLVLIGRVTGIGDIIILKAGIAI